MPRDSEFKFTYTTLSSPAEEVHEAFEQAVAEVRRSLGARHPLWIAGEARMPGRTFEDRSPIDSRLLVGSFSMAEKRDVADAITSASEAFPE